MHLQRLNLLHLMVKEQMHLQENTVIDLDLGVKVTQDVAQYPLCHVTYAPAKFEVATLNGLGDAIISKYSIEFDLGVKATRDVVEYSLHHLTYAHAEFEVTSSNGLRGDAFTRKYII